MNLLPLVWAGLIGFVIFMYVLLDGFDLGIGILFPFIRNPYEREIMMVTAVPVWDGNETWLVLGAALLYGAFPIVYSTLLPMLYLPIILMLVALIFRGIAFEFLFKAHRSRVLWDVSFSLGSIIATFSQGVLLGTFIRGFGNASVPLTYSGWQWLHPFCFMTGVALVFGYALLGACWLIAKTQGPLQKKMIYAAKISLIGVAIFVGIVSIWTPFTDPSVMQRWFTLPNFFYLLPLPIITGFATLSMWYCLVKQYDYLPFVHAIILFLCSYVGLVISIYPFIIPHRLSIWDAAAPMSSQIFILVGVIILLPVLIGYTFYQYRVFKGKVVKPDLHY